MRTLLKGNFERITYQSAQKIEQLQSELGTCNTCIAELERSELHVETLNALALILAKRIDELRCSLATEQLTNLLAK